MENFRTTTLNGFASRGKIDDFLEPNFGGLGPPPRHAVYGKSCYAGQSNFHGGNSKKAITDFEQNEKSSHFCDFPVSYTHLTLPTNREV